MSYHKCHAALCVILPDSMCNSMRNSHTQAKPRINAIAAVAAVATAVRVTLHKSV